MILSNRWEVLRLILARPESTFDDILKGNCRKLWYLLRCQSELPVQSKLFWHQRRTHKGWQLIDQHLKFIAVYKVKAQTAKFKIVKNNLLLKGVFTYEVGIFFDKKTSSLSYQLLYSSLLPTRVKIFGFWFHWDPIQMQVYIRRIG